MIPYDSFLLDPPMLVGSGWLAARITRGLPVRARRPALGLLRRATVGGFVITSASLYLNLEWTRWLWELCRAESGRDWMLNSGVFHFEHRKPSPKVHAAAVAILATYPLWYRLGLRLGGVRRSG